MFMFEHACYLVKYAVQIVMYKFFYKVKCGATIIWLAIILKTFSMRILFHIIFAFLPILKNCLSRMESSPVMVFAA